MKRKIVKGRVFFKKLQQFFTTTVIGGIFVLLPIGLLIWLAQFFFKTLSGIITPLTKLFNFSPNIQQWVIDLVAFSLVIALFFFIGLTVRTNFGKRAFSYIENHWLRRLPFYGSLRDALQTLSSGNKAPFKQVVLVDVYGTDTRMTGFITDKQEVANGYITVFVPTGPNPTNGFIFHLKSHQIEYIDTKPEDAMRTIIGVGVGSSILFEKEED